MAGVLKPPTPTYIEVQTTKRYKVQALCNRCGVSLLTLRFYCPECHQVLFPKQIQLTCLSCGKTFSVTSRRSNRKYCPECYGGGFRGHRLGGSAQTFLQMVGGARETEIAEEAGVSRQRIHQLEKRFGVCHLDPKRRKARKIALKPLDKRPEVC